MHHCSAQLQVKVTLNALLGDGLGHTLYAANKHNIQRLTTL